MKIKIIWKDNTEYDLQADEIDVTEKHIILYEDKNRFCTIIDLNKIKEYFMEK